LRDKTHTSPGGSNSNSNSSSSEERTSNNNNKFGQGAPGGPMARYPNTIADHHRHTAVGGERTDGNGRHAHSGTAPREAIAFDMGAHEAASRHKRRALLRTWHSGDALLRAVDAHIAALAIAQAVVDASDLTLADAVETAERGLCAADSPIDAAELATCDLERVQAAIRVLHNTVGDCIDWCAALGAELASLSASCAVAPADESLALACDNGVGCCCCAQVGWVNAWHGPLPRDQEAGRATAAGSSASRNWQSPVKSGPDAAPAASDTSPCSSRSFSRLAQAGEALPLWPLGQKPHHVDARTTRMAHIVWRCMALAESAGCRLGPPSAEAASVAAAPRGRTESSAGTITPSESASVERIMVCRLGHALAAQTWLDDPCYPTASTMLPPPQ
jgi:hypothetical protein